MTDYIWHVTLNSGHAVKQHRSLISDDAIAALADVLDGILQGGRMQVPGTTGYLVNGSAHGHDLIGTVWRGPWDQRIPIITMGTALRSRSARSLWELMHDQSSLPLATDRRSHPGCPWQADRVEVGSALHMDALAWTGDFSRCLAWAWAEYRGV